MKIINCRECGISKKVNKRNRLGLCKKCYWKIHHKTIASKIRNKDTRLRREYNITYEEYLNMLLRHNHSCAICKRDFKDNILDRKHMSYIDHNHNTNKVRGLLCINCNSLIGNCKEDVRILEYAISYLRKWE